jgi:flagellar secretion chaperone FliS
MFGQNGYVAARARYRDLDLTTKVEGASPHRLIAILFEELLKSLDTIAAGLAAGSTPFTKGMPERRARATAILLGLEGSLDHENGGELARGLAAIYREARRLLGEGDAASVAKTRTMIAEVSEAWSSIG